MLCGAEENDQVTSLPAFTGTVRPPEAIQCLRDLHDRDRIKALPASQIGPACDGPLAVGCTGADGSGCNNEVIIPASIIPDDLVTIEEGGPTWEQSSVDLASVLYHEAIHTVQPRGDCSDSREVEAYDQQVRFTNWLGLQIQTFAIEPDSWPCESLDDAVGLAPCVRAFALTAFPELDPSEPIPEPACADMRALRDRAGSIALDASISRTAYQEYATHCEALTAASSSIRFSSEQWPSWVAVSPQDPIVYQFETQLDGTNEVLRTYNTGFDDVLDLRIIRDALGRDILLVAGILDGEGAILASRDVAIGEFGGDPDGMFDENITTLTSDLLTEASELVQAGTSPLLVFDRAGQAAFEIVLDGDGEPDALSLDAAILIPMGSDAVSLVHEPDRPSAYAKLRFADSASDTRLLQFDDADLDGIYTFVAEGTAQELRRLPPAFLTTPVTGASGAWVIGGIGDTIQIAPSDASGNIGAAIGSGVVPATGQLWIGSNRAFISGEYLRVKDTTNSLLGAWSLVIPPRIQAHYYQPHWGPEAGGTTVHVRGQGFTGITSVKFDGVPVAFQVIDDRRMKVTSPAGTGTARVTASNASGQREVGSFTFVGGGHDKRWDSSGQFATWSPDGAAGWSCGANVIPTGAEPAGGDRDGCRFAGVAGKWGYLQSPTVNLTGTGRLFLRVEHTSSFGTDGDGVVVQVGDASTWYTLRPLARSARRLDGASCSGSGGSRTCVADPPSHGLLGDSRTAGNPNWREDLYELPALFDSATWLKIRIAASNMSSASSATYNLNAIELTTREDPRATAYGEWTNLASFDSSCGGVTVTGPFQCTSSPIPGAVGPALRYWNAGAGATGTASIAFSAPAARRVSLLVRHAVNLTAGTSVGTGLGRLQVCCGSCTTVTPVGGYPPVAPGTTAGFGDEGPELVWMNDEVDISSWAGAGSCTAKLLGTGASASSQPGWVVDSMAVRVR